MRKKIYVFGIALLLNCTACNDWLTVQPETSILAEDLYSTDEGIKQVLDGVYLRMRGILYYPAGEMGGGGLVEKATKSIIWEIMIIQRRM